MCYLIWQKRQGYCSGLSRWDKYNHKRRDRSARFREENKITETEVSDVATR